MILTKAQLIAQAALLGLTCGTVGTTVGVTQAPKIRKAVHRLVHKPVHRTVHRPAPVPTPECPPATPVVLSPAPLPIPDRPIALAVPPSWFGTTPPSGLFPAPALVRPPDEGGPVVIIPGRPGPVPEPATWALMVSGFVLVGIGARNRHAQQA